jgi:GNAT superfamily N-acetyltransferase
MARAFRIELLSAAAAADTSLVPALTGLINDVYAEAERGLWRDGATRTTEEEVAGLVRAGEIAVVAAAWPAAAWPAAAWPAAAWPAAGGPAAGGPAAGGRVLGCVRIRRLSAGMSEFGMLAVADSHRGTGMGTELVRFAEATARRAGHATMQLELLVPREWKHPSKEFLAQWYSRIGYTVFRTGSTDEFYPQLTPLLATPCDFVVYRKDFGDAGFSVSGA